MKKKDFKYVKEIQEYVEKSFWGRRLDEDKVVNPDLYRIIDRLVYILKKYKQNFTKYKHEYVIKNILFKDEFINDVNLTIEFVPRDENKCFIGGGFNPDNVVKKLSTDGDYKLYGVEINLIQYTPRTERLPFLDTWSIENTLWHEMMHCHRYYQILLKNDNYPLSIRRSDNTYSNALYLRNNTSNTNCDRLAKWIGDCYYKMNQNEIAAQCNTIHGFIRRHPEINIRNYKNYLNNLDVKKTYNQIFFLLETLQGVKTKDENDSERKCVVSILRNIFDDEEHTDGYIIKKSINNVNYYLSYINSKMYAAISYSLQYFNRTGNTMKDILRTSSGIDKIEKPIWTN